LGGRASVIKIIIKYNFMTKDLKEKAIKIQGKEYVLVSDRIIYFNATYKNGSIQTNLISEPTSNQIVIQAVVVPDNDKPNRIFTGYSQAVVGQGYINKTSALENAETSAVGRALAMMGIGVIDSVASVDEINKAKQSEQPAKQEVKKTTSQTKSREQALSLLRVKVAKEFGDGEMKPEDVIEIISKKSGINLKSIKELTEPMANNILEFWK